MVAPSRRWHDCAPDVIQQATSAKWIGEKETDGGRSACFEPRHPVSRPACNRQALPFSFFLSLSLSSSPSNQQIAEATWQAIAEEGRGKKRKIGGGRWRLGERLVERGSLYCKERLKREREREREGGRGADKTSNNSITRRGNVTLPDRASKCEQNFVKALLANSRHPLLVSRYLSTSFFFPSCKENSTDFRWWLNVILITFSIGSLWITDM